MHLLMGFDGNYAMPAAVTIRSLGRSLLAGESTTIHILGVDLSAEVRERIAESAGSSIELVWYDFDPSQIADLPVSSIKDEIYITRSAYTPIFFDHYIPPEVDRLLFLDADTLVRQSPLGLSALDLDGHTLAAVQDFGCSAIGLPKGVAGWRELGLDGRLPAFNTGFVLIDRAAWKASRVEDRCIDYLTRFGSSINYVDQDCLNATNAGNWHHLDSKWNYQVVIEWAFGGDKAMAYAFIARDQLDEARSDPAIVHYNGDLKPWLTKGSKLPFLAEWQAALDETAWRGTAPAAPKRASPWQIAKYRGRKASRALFGR